MKEGSNSKTKLGPSVEDRTEDEAPEGDGGASEKYKHTKDLPGQVRTHVSETISHFTTVIFTRKAQQWIEGML